MVMQNASDLAFEIASPLEKARHLKLLSSDARTRSLGTRMLKDLSGAWKAFGGGACRDQFIEKEAARVKRRGTRFQVAHVRRILAATQFGAFAAGQPAFSARRIQALPERHSVHLGFPFLEGEVCTRSVLAQVCRALDCGPWGIRDMALLTLAWASALPFSELVALTWSQLECLPDGLLVRPGARCLWVPASDSTSLLCPLPAVLRWRSWCFGQAMALNAQVMLVFPTLERTPSGFLVGAMSSADAHALCVKRAKSSGYAFKLFPGCIQTGWTLQAMESGHSLETVLAALGSPSSPRDCTLPLLA